MKKTRILFFIMLSLILVGCSSKPSTEGKTADINAIHTAVKDIYGDDYLASMPLEMENLVDMMGVSADDINKFVAEVPMMSTHVDTFVAIEAKEGKGDAVFGALNTYRTALIEDGLAYPMNLPKINASKVIQHGDYVFFVMLGAYNDDMDASEEDQIVFAQEEVKKAEDAIAGFFK